MNSGVRKQWPLFFVLLASTALIFTSFALISFLIYLVVIGTVLSKNSGAWLERTVWVYIFFFCFLALLNSIGSLAGLRLSYIEPLLFLGLFTWVVAIRATKTAKSKHMGCLWPGIIAALAICVYINIPVLTSFSSTTILRYSAKTTDDISNIARIEANRKVGGLLYQKQADVSQLIDPGTAVSPQGWHVNGAFIESLIIKMVNSDKISIRLLSYWIYKTVWLFIAVVMFYMLIREMVNAFFGLSDRLFDILSAIGAAGVALIFLVALYGYGFQDFIASIVLVCASLLLAARLIENTSSSHRKLYLFGLAALTATSLYVWTLAGAIVGLVTLTVLIKEFLANRKGITTWWQWFLVAILGTLASPPVYYLLKHGSGRGLNTINSDGAVPPIRIVAVLIFFLVTLLAMAIIKFKGKKWLLSLISMTALEFFALAIYQQITIGEQRYYAIKLAFLVSIITSIVFLSVAIRLLNAFFLSKIYRVVIYILILIMLPFALGLDLRKSAYPLKDSTPIKAATATTILNLSTSGGNQNTVIYTSDKEESYLATKLWSSVNLYNSPERKTLLEKLSGEINN
jgi:hypothetical protein